MVRGGGLDSATSQTLPRRSSCSVAGELSRVELRLWPTLLATTSPRTFMFLSLKKAQYRIVGIVWFCVDLNQMR